MQNIKKYFMTLALLLTAVTGAWAQTAFKVVEFKVPADWETDNNPVTKPRHGRAHPKQVKLFSSMHSMVIQ